MPEHLDVLPAEKLLDLPEGLEIWRIHPLRLKEQDRNARVQTAPVFNALVRNIKKRGTMESLPFIARTDEDFWIISGHHRVRAAIQAELTSIIILADPSLQTRDAVLAKQIAHNSINGTDNASVLLQLLDEITNMDALLEAAVDRSNIEKSLLTINAAAPDVKLDLDWQMITFVFLPTRVAQFQRLCDSIPPSVLVGVADLTVFDAFKTAMKKLGRTEEIRSVGALVARMTDLVREHLATIEAEKQ